MFAEDATRFVDEMVQTAEQFFVSNAEETIDFQFGRIVVRVSLPSSEVEVSVALRRTLPPTLGGNPDFLIYLIDERVGAVRPSITWNRESIHYNGTVNVHHDEGVAIAFESSTKAINVFDQQRAVGVVLVDNVSRYLMWAITCPFRLLLNWVADRVNGELMHAAVIEKRGTGVAIIGRSGLGKSTLSIAAAISGEWSLVSDDFVLVENSKSAFAIYNTVKLGADDLLRLDLAINDVSIPLVYGKHVLSIRQTPQLRHITSAEISCVVLPTPSQIEQVLPAQERDLLPELVLHSIAGTLGGGPRSLRRMRDLVKKNPCFTMRLSPDWQENLSTLDEIVQRAGVDS